MLERYGETCVRAVHGKRSHTRSRGRRLRDPSGLKIEIVRHHVIKGRHHVLIRFTPDDLDKWRAGPLGDHFQGKDFLTIGAGPGMCPLMSAMMYGFEAGGAGSGSCLVKGLDRPHDVNKEKQGGFPIPVDCEDEFMERLLKLFDEYDDGFAYSWFGSQFSGNSNSFISGLLGAAGIPVPIIEDVKVPGYGRPVPLSEFGVPNREP